MEQEKIKNSLDAVTLTEDASARMYNNIQQKYKKKTVIKRRIKLFVPAAAVFAVISALTVWGGSALFSGDANEYTETTRPVEIQTPVSAAETYSGDGSGGVFPLSPDTPTVQYGEYLSLVEASRYIKENTVSIKSSLSASGVKTADFKIASSGYRHIKCEKNADKYLLMMNCLDYPVYSGDDLVGIVTLIKDDGRIGASPSFGSAYFESYENYLESNKDTELIYLYVGETEIVVSNGCGFYSEDDGSVYTAFLNISDPFEHFYSEDAVYIPQ